MAYLRWTEAKGFFFLCRALRARYSHSGGIPAAGETVRKVSPPLDRGSPRAKSGVFCPSDLGYLWARTDQNGKLPAGKISVSSIRLGVLKDSVLSKLRVRCVSNREIVAFPSVALRIGTASSIELGLSKTSLWDWGFPEGQTLSLQLEDPQEQEL